MAKNIEFMMKLVENFLSDKTPRYIFELDFQAEILDRYKKMVREDRDYAEYFYDMLSEDGVDQGDELSDSEFKKLIQRQYDEVKNVANEGFW